ncbi:trace amine-associated receptor 13c-like [Leuresthes tenuis]|uniref:trace amine-associated receptor 13c-like n=1 Tax=Leuresthes tenuis TaxID=355514 RepID=UPI003B505D96
MEETELCFPQLNTSCRRPKRPHFETMLIYVVLSCISVLTVTLNLLVIISISHFRKLHTPTNLLLLSLAVSDFFVGLLMFFQIMLIDGCWYLGDILCVMYQYLAYTITAASTGNMVIISIDRYVAICYPMHYSSKITQKRVKICVCVCWICSAIVQSLILKDDLKQPGRYNSCYGECIIVVNYIVGYIDMTFSFIVPIAVIIVLYFRIFVVAVSQARAMRSQITAAALQRSETELCFPQLNASCRRTQRPHFEVLLTYIIVSSISVLTVILNLLVIISISHFRQLHTPTNLLLLSLAVSDLFVGLLMFFQIMLINGCWLLGDLMCIMYQCIAYFVTMASLGTTIMISIDRYVAICYPMHYSIQITQKRVKICVCVCWMFSVIVQSLILKDGLNLSGRYDSCIGQCVVFVSYIAGLADTIVSFIVPITVIVVLYLRVFVVAVSQARAMRSHITATNLKHSVITKKSELKAARALGVVVVVSGGFAQYSNW